MRRSQELDKCTSAERENRYNSPMRATTETRRTLLFVATLLLTPPILWGVFGLMERFPPRRAFSGESTSPRDYQQVSKIRMVRDQLKWAGNQEKWEMIPPLVQREFGNDCPFELLPLRAEALCPGL